MLAVVEGKLWNSTALKVGGVLFTVVVGERGLLYHAEYLSLKIPEWYLVIFGISREIKKTFELGAICVV